MRRDEHERMQREQQQKQLQQQQQRHQQQLDAMNTRTEEDKGMEELFRIVPTLSLGTNTPVTPKQQDKKRKLLIQEVGGSDIKNDEHQLVASIDQFDSSHAVLWRQLDLLVRLIDEFIMVPLLHICISTQPHFGSSPTPSIDIESNPPFSYCCIVLRCLVV